jgi:uncharacterized phage protein gp47/JayE
MDLTKGFKRKTFEEIKAEIEQKLVDALGSINLMSPSVFGNIVSIFTDREAQVWEQIEALYSSMYPQSAEGYSLDGICALNGITRSQATFSRAVCQLTAVLYTKIPKNSLIKVQNTSNLFALQEDIVVTNEKCQSIKVRIKNNNSLSYGLIINGQLLRFEKTKNETIEEIALFLSLIVKEANIGINVNCEGGAISLAAGSQAEFSCITTEEIEVIECTNNALLLATEKGAIAAPIGSLNIIHTPISGWISCNNLTAAKIGNNLESDKALRSRREQSIKIGGSGSLEAIRANLLNLSTVTAVSIAENATSEISKDGLPPHSFEVLITGGNDVDIAQAIWQKKPAGIRSYGKCTVITFDSEDREQVVFFSRPVVRFIYGKIIITKTKHFVEAAEESIKANLISQINSLGVGNPVILKSLFVSIFSESGIANAYIELGSSLQESNTPILKEVDVNVKNNEVALTDLLKIQIVLEDF